MGLFLSRSFSRAAHLSSFVSFFVRSESPFLHPDPPQRQAVAPFERNRAARGSCPAVAPLALIAAINPRFSVAPITAIIVLLVPTITHASPIASALDRVLEVALGGVTGLVVSFLLLPSSFDHEVDMGGVVIVERTRSAPVIST